MRLPRFTVRRLMVAVAIVGVLLAAVLGLERRREWLRRLSQRHESRAMVCDMEKLIGAMNRQPATWLANRQARLEYHKSLARKYRQAASHPWLPVAPDPPEPE
jgi:hypothetical protein